MKRCSIAVLLLISQAVPAQPVVKLYGYSQVFVPGMIPQDDVPDENGGKPVKKSHVVTNYYFFIAASPAAIVQPNEIWLDGKGFKAIRQQVVKTPVTSDSPEKKTLVAATTLKVTQLTLGDSLTSAPKPTQTLRRLMAANQFVLVYSWKGKRYYTAIKKLTVLSPVHGV